MMRSLLALTALLIVTVGIAQADYIIIKVNLGVSPTKEMPGIGKPDPGKPGIPGFPGQPGQPQPGQPQPPGPPDPNALTVVVFFEYSKAEGVNVPNLPANTYITRILHKWGHSYLINDGRFIQIHPQDDKGLPKPIKRPTVMQLFQAKQKETEKDKSGGKLLDAAEFALRHGLLKQCEEIMDKLAKLDSKEPDVVAAVKAFEKVRKDLAQPIARDEPAIDWWKGELRCKMDRSAHYCLLYDGANPAEVKGRLDRLERNMEAFYYWFALKGKTPPVPERRLGALLIDKASDLKQLYLAAGAPPFIADGFFDRRDNLAVFSTSRLDQASDLLGKHFSELLQAGWNLKQIMDLKAKNLKVPNTPQEAAHVHTMALIKRILEEESELATTSHLGTRQILAAINVLPRNVQIPEWVQFGYPAFFETPKFDPYTHTGAFWPGTGALSWTYWVQFKLWDIEKQLDDPLEALTGVLTDRYFREAHRNRSMEQLLRARTYSWALAYYLAQRQLDGLRRYGDELSQLPRDLEFDGDVLQGCFARAFNLTDAAGGINENKLAGFAKDWFDFVSRDNLPVPELLQEAQRVIKEKKIASKLGAP
jgi:hypothetical protein